MNVSEVTCIIVTYNSARVIDACLGTIPADVHIIAVDNGSSDETLAKLTANPHVEVVQSTNIGYGRGANLGLRRVTTPYALLLNPDVVLCEGAVDSMRACVQKYPQVGVVGAQMIEYQNGAKHNQKNYTFDDDGVCHTPWIVGALMFFNMEILRKVGLFDERIFLFFEETDLCDRMRRSGHQLVVCKAAEAIHETGTSSLPSPKVTKIKNWHCGWSRVYYYRKHYGMRKAIRKSLSKIYKNIRHLIGSLFFPSRKDTLATAYETLGLFSNFLGLDAFRKDGTARMT